MQYSSVVNWLRKFYKWSAWTVYILTDEKTNKNKKK